MRNEYFVLLSNKRFRKIVCRHFVYAQIVYYKPAFGVFLFKPYVLNVYIFQYNGNAHLWLQLSQNTGITHSRL
jgi:hypothetical protein